MKTIHGSRKKLALEVEFFGQINKEVYLFFSLSSRFMNFTFLLSVEKRSARVENKIFRIFFETDPLVTFKCFFEDERATRETTIPITSGSFV